MNDNELGNLRCPAISVKKLCRVKDYLDYIKIIPHVVALNLLFIKKLLLKAEGFYKLCVGV